MGNLIKKLKRFFFIRKLKMMKLYKLAKKERWTDIIISIQEFAEMKRLIDTRRDYLTKEKLIDFGKLASHLIKEVELKKERICTLKSYEMYDYIWTRLNAWKESAKMIEERIIMLNK